MYIDLFPKSPSVYSDSVFWYNVFQGLKLESGLDRYDTEFYTWLGTEWGIKCCTAQPDYSGIIEGIEIDEATYSMLLLKFTQSS